VRAAGLIALAALGWLAPACGEDDAPVQPPPGRATPATVAAAGGGAGSARQLAPQVSIEDRVVCRVESNAQKKCDPKAPRCGQGEHCITNTEGSFCGPCAERDTIRRPFRPRDFVATFDMRDPFQSFFVSQPDLGGGAGSGGGASAGSGERSTDPAKSCTRDDQLVAQNYSYQDLRLVGIVTQGVQRKVLMLDSTNLGHIIKRGDCVGKEKAVVKEIGKEYITFELQQELAGAAGRRPPEQRSVQLYPKQIPVSSLPSEQPATAPPVAPVVPPPSATGPATAPATAENGPPAARPPTRIQPTQIQPTQIQIVPPQAQGPAVPPQAPTTLTP